MGSIVHLDIVLKIFEFLEISEFFLGRVNTPSSFEPLAVILVDYSLLCRKHSELVEQEPKQEQGRLNVGGESLILLSKYVIEQIVGIEQIFLDNIQHNEEKEEVIVKSEPKEFRGRGRLVP